MKVVDNPTIELEEKDIEALKGFRELIKNMPCSSLHCVKCPFSKICDLMDINEPIESMMLNIQKALTKALIK